MSAPRLSLTAFDLAQRFVGLREMPGAADNPTVMAMLTLDQAWPANDETPWCSAFVNYICWLLRLPRSKDLRARSWLGVGMPVADDAVVGWDVVILNRGDGPQDASVLDAPGHVGFFAGFVFGSIRVLGGNQGNAVSSVAFPKSRLLGIRRLWDGPAP